MNYSTAIFLINTDVRAIAVTYEKIDLAQDTTQMKYQPAYLAGGQLPKDAVVFKTMNKDIKVSDFVIVPTDTRHGMTVCKVVATDIEIDYDSDKECHWLIGTVNTANFEEIRQQEEKAILAIKAAEVNTKREELSKSLIANLGNNAKQIPMLNKTEPEPETEKEA
ncbi:MAG: hypothetical protein KAI73_05155 [Rhodospirillaceae bacterium]|nr:hypothetical protein [Rhodospirillaceae bacterium]